MTDVPATVADFFARDAEAFSRTPLPAEAAEAVKQDLGALDRAALEALAMTDLLRSLYDALDPRLDDILRSAWGSLNQLQEYRDAHKHPPEETSNVRFGRHKVTSKHHPTVEILLNEKAVASLTFDVLLTLQVSATTLVVRAGRIWQARGTEFQGEAALSYRGFTLIRKSTEKFSLPGAIDFSDGIPIPPLPQAAG
jgi:hypothetical protein